MNAAERREAIAAGHKRADVHAETGVDLREITDTDYVCLFAPESDETLDEVLMGEWLQVANAAARERWAEIKRERGGQ